MGGGRGEGGGGEGRREGGGKLVGEVLMHFHYTCIAFEYM